MLEVCFQNCVKGALSMAQNCEKGRIGGAIGVITDSKGVFSFFAKRKAIRQYRKRELELQKKAVSLGGKREDIACIPFELSEGDIQAPICPEECPRKAFLRERISLGRLPEETEPAVQEFWENCMADLEKLESNPPKIRVWLDDTPDAQCGLLFLADRLNDRKPEIHVVQLPEKVTDGDSCTIEYRGWGDVEPRLFGTFLNRETVLTQEEVEVLAGRWQTLKGENGVLRVIQNGNIVTADIDYYDELIQKEFPENSCKIANIIANALARQKIPTGDVFIAERIRHFVHSKELVILEENRERFYSTVVGRANNSKKI